MEGLESSLGLYKAERQTIFGKSKQPRLCLLSLAPCILNVLCVMYCKYTYILHITQGFKEINTRVIMHAHWQERRH